MQVADTVRFLEAFAPSELELLQRQHPEHRALLQAGGEVLGTAEEDVALEAVQRSLAQMEPVALTAMAQTTKRLHGTRRLELLGSLLTLISSGGVVGATVGLRSLAGAAVLGIVGFLSSAVPLIVSWLRGVATGEGTLAENFVKLRDCVYKANLLHQQIQRASGGEAKEALIARGNEIAHEMFVALTNLGFMPSLTRTQV